MTSKRIGRAALWAMAFAATSASTAHAQSCRTVVRFTTDLGTFDVSLLDEDAPVTVANFLRYLDSGRYESTFIHRSVPGFVIQGGGWRYSDATGLAAVPTYPPIPNEFSFAHSNVARTFAMAKLGGDPNSATNQFFINLVDNSANLDHQNGGFVVFGEVTAGWPVVQAIAALSTANFSGLNQALTDVPVRGGGPIMESILVEIHPQVIQGCPCYANCDGSTAAPVLGAADFACFMNRFSAGDTYANCDHSTAAPVLNVLDFMCYLNRYAAGCP